MFHCFRKKVENSKTVRLFRGVESYQEREREGVENIEPAEGLSQTNFKKFPRNFDIVPKLPSLL